MSTSTKEYFPFVSSEGIPFEGPSSRNPLAFKHYNAEEEVLGRKMKDWLRFAVCYWHTWRGTGKDPFGGDTIGAVARPWETETEGLDPNSIEVALRRVDVHFEFLRKLKVDYYCFHDFDVAPEGQSYKESCQNLDRIADRLEQRQKETGIKLLWGTANLFSHRRYMSGAATNPDPLVFARAAAQVKKALEVTKRLGGENYVLWGGREGYQSIWNTDLKLELDHLAAFLRLVVEHKNKIGFTGQLLIEPKPREPTTHQYDYDAATVIGFLRQHNLEKDYKLNLEANHATLAGHSAEHEVAVARSNAMLGSIDANHNESLLGWDTDMFPTDVRMATFIVHQIVKQGGLQPGGLNFDAKLRRESVDLEDLFIAHINGMDCYARALRAVAQIHQEGIYDQLLAARYAGWQTAFGQEVASGKKSLADLAQWVEEHDEEPKLQSGKEEKVTAVISSYL